MKVARSKAELRGVLAPLRSGRTIGFVPTMGALHAGHVSLIGQARTETDVVLVSIFVNPLQFGPNEDLASYPRPVERDLELVEGAGVDVVFLPPVGEMYPEGAEVTVSAGRLGTILEGTHRPGHFDGVATVVAKLFNIVEPDVAFFGQKDAQQVAVLKQMVRDLDFGIELRVGETVRESDGLALSSRNVYLDRDERTKASALHQALAAGAEALRAGSSPGDAERKMHRILAAADGIQVDYAVAVDPDSFGVPQGPPVLLLVAARVGSTRLIDNMFVEARDRGTG